MAKAVTKSKYNVFWCDERGVFGVFKSGKLYENDTYSNCYYRTLADAKQHALEVAENDFKYINSTHVIHQ